MTAAVSTRQADVVRALADLGVDPSVQVGGETAYAVAEDVACVQALAACGGRPCAGDWRAVGRAVQLVDVALLRALCAAGVPVEAPDALSASGTMHPLYAAVGMNSMEVVDVLLAAGAGVNTVQRSSGNTALFNVQSPAMARRLIAAGAAVDAVDLHNWPALAWTMEERPRCSAVLVEAGASVNTVDKWHYTLLHWAHSMRCTRMLLEAGAHPDLPDSILMTPLHWAASYGRPGVVHLLLQYGASPAAREAKGKKPVDIIGINEGADGSDVELTGMDEVVAGDAGDGAASEGAAAAGGAGGAGAGTGLPADSAWARWVVRRGDEAVEEEPQPTTNPRPLATRAALIRRLLVAWERSMYGWSRRREAVAAGAMAAVAGGW